jgi:hypothetical protein
MITHENKFGMFIHRGPYSILDRHEQASVYLDIFDGGHDMDLSTAEALRENIEFFESEGIEAGVWIGYTIGHGAITSLF